MRLSLNQVEHGVRKAVRGAGLNWGLAEEAGRAIRWLESVDLPAVHQLAQHLEAVARAESANLKIKPQSGAWKAIEGKTSPLMAGPSIVDWINGGNLDTAGDDQLEDNQILVIEDVAFPMLYAGYAGVACAHSEKWVRLVWGDIKVYCSPDGLGFSGNRGTLEVAEAVTLEVQLIEPDELVMKVFWYLSSHPCSVIPKDWKTVEMYAHRTYVEATEASRIAGAGAGLQDND